MDLVHIKVHIKRPTFTKLGNCFTVFFNDSLFILIGPHWPFMFCVVPIILAVLIGFVSVVAPQMEFSYQIIGTCIILVTLLSYLVTAMKDPGVVLSEYESDLEEDTDGKTTLCNKCLIFRDRTIEHCDDCGLCMKNLDHHCIFTGKCIAENNLFCFYTFLVSIFGFFGFSLFWVITSLPHALKDK